MRSTKQVTRDGNDLDNWPLAGFCLELDRSWRGDSDLAILGPEDLRNRLFPLKGDDGYDDRIFLNLTVEERADLVYGWHLCGRKMAMGYDAARIASIVHDAFRAGDLDGPMFARSIGPELLLSRVTLEEWWGYYRSGRHNKASLLRLLKTAYHAYGLFSGTWFFTNAVVHTKQGVELRGVEALGAILSKSELVDWLTRTHAAVVLGKSFDEDELLKALTIDKLVDKMNLDDLLLLVDALASKLELAEAPAELQDAGPPSAAAPQDRGATDTIESPPPSGPQASGAAAPANDPEAADTVVPAPPASEPPSERSTKPSRLPAYFEPPTDEEIKGVTDRIEESQPGTPAPKASIPEQDPAEERPDNTDDLNTVLAYGPPPGAVDDDIAFDPDERPSVEIDATEMVGEAELIAVGDAAEAASRGEMVLVKPSKVVEWGAYPPDAEASAAAARERIASDGSRSTSSVNRAPTPDSQRATEATAPSVPPPAEPTAPGSLRRGGGPPPLPKPAPRPKRGG